MNEINRIREKSKSFLSFTIGTETYAVHVAHVSSIIEVPEITEIPNSPDHIKGVLNLRGTAIPVIDTCIKLTKRLIEYTDLTCVLVLEVSHNEGVVQVGALVDKVNEVLEINTEDVLLPPDLIYSNGEQMFIDGMYKQDEKFVMLLNVNRLIESRLLEYTA